MQNQEERPANSDKNVAHVILDVSSRKVDRPFDYLIPIELKPWIQVGSRVAIPFRSQLCQGYVIELSEKGDKRPYQMKAIQQVLDSTPPLTSDLVQLGKWMSRRWLCPLTLSLQAMLPAALKKKKETYVMLDPLTVWKKEEVVQYAELFQSLRQPNPLTLSSLLTSFSSYRDVINKWFKEKKIIEKQRLKDKVRKTVKQIVPAPKKKLLSALNELPVRAVKQRELITYFIAHPEAKEMPQLLKELHISRPSVQQLAKKQLVSIQEIIKLRDPYAERYFRPTSPFSLTASQKKVFLQIKKALQNRKQTTFLLHGITGSGKTEIYLQAIQHELTAGRQAIVLVPEISLTPQIVERFKSRFGLKVAVLHSRLSAGEKYDEWSKIRQGQAEVAVGARSAIFAPFQNIGLIVIDEEHETSYKQVESPKYHARNVAIERARQHQATVVLGSATPALETYDVAKHGKKDALLGSISYLSLSERVGNQPLPKVYLVDMREQLHQGNRTMFSPSLVSGIQDRLHKGEQTILFLNRRGYATFVMCRSCGYTVECPHCEVSLIYHRRTAQLRCHYCGYTEREPLHCPCCNSSHIRFFGTGTQKIEEQLYLTLPGIRVIRMDFDTTTKKGAHERFLKDFHEHKADLLLGTQMVAKGLDFPLVTLVGVLAADAALHLPDFRSAERTFQLLTQVAGRAGRHQLPGEVIIQTYDPKHDVIQFVQKHNYSAFANQALHSRQSLAYPPFGRLIMITFSGKQRHVTMSLANRFTKRLIENTVKCKECQVLGPVACHRSKLKDRYRFQCVVKYQKELDAINDEVEQTVHSLSERMKQDDVKCSIDVDPQMTI